jgi:signal transduction histidine kinase
MPFTRLGLQGKVTIIIAVTVISVVGVSTCIAMWLTRQPVEEEIYRKALAQARLTAHHLAYQGALENPGELLNALRQMEHDVPSVKQSDIYLHQPQHQLLTTTALRGEHLELDHLPNVEQYNEFERPEADQIAIETPDGDFWIIGTAIGQAGKPLGCLNLKVSKSRLNAITWDLVLRNLLVMLASIGVVILVINTFFLRWVRRPVKEMVRVMAGAEGGQLQLRAGVPSHDEIGQLAQHLNRMLDRIENFNTELGRKVQEATATLARRNEELRQIYEELLDTQRSLARSERLAVAGQLATSLAHEIGTPLNSISGHVQLLSRSKTWDAASARRLQTIEKQIDNIVRTVKQLLSWSRKFDLKIEELEVRHLLEESVLLASPALESRKIKVETEWPPHCPRLYGDSGYLQQVMLNLINNSMDAMPRGGELRVTLRYPFNGDEREVAVKVRDTGVGINPETLPHIFDPMFTTKRIGTGAGLGLAICDQIIRQHAGRIQVESQPNRGTCFTIILPLDCRERLEGALGAAGIPVASAAT